MINSEIPQDAFPLRKLSIDLGVSSDELKTLIQSGHIVSGKPTSTADGHRLLYHRDTEHNDIYISGKAHFRYCDGRELFNQIIDESENGIIGYTRIRKRYYQAYVDQSMAGNKFARMNPSDYFGRRLIERAHFGRLTPTTIELAETVYRKVVNTEIRTHFNSEHDAVVELGSGTGFGLVDLFMELGCPEIPVIACELSLWGNRCLSELAKRLAFQKIEARSFDLSNPDLSFASRFRRPLFVSVGSLVYAKPSISSFLAEMAKKVRQFDCVFLEPISYELAGHYNIKPLFARQRAIQYGFSLDLFAQIKAMENSGKIVVHEVIPDLIGATPYSALSLIRMSSP